MKILILAAGYGTRLYPIIKDTPKALLAINEKPLINYIVDKVKHLEAVSEILVVTNNKFCRHFEDWAKTNDSGHIPITIVNDGTNTPEDRLGSIGDIKFVLDHQKINEDLLVIGGDNLFDYSLDAYVDFAKNQKEQVTIGLYELASIEEASNFGVVSVDENKKVTLFEEKPDHPKSKLIAMCCYYFPSNVLGLLDTYLEQSEKEDRAGDYIRWLAEEKGVYGFTFDGNWYDIGSIESYEQAKNVFR